MFSTLSIPALACSYFVLDFCFWLVLASLFLERMSLHKKGINSEYFEYQKLIVSPE